MTVTRDPVLLNEWIVCGWQGQMPVEGSVDTTLLGQKIRVSRDRNDTYAVVAVDEDGCPARELPTKLAFGHVFTTLGSPKRPLPDMPEFDEPDRRVTGVGCIRIYASPYRIIENFLDLAHFPFVHTDILGSPDSTEVMNYKVEHRKDVDEIWAVDCQFFQPAASKAAKEGQMTQYTYRVMSPISCVLYKSAPPDPTRFDLFSLFLQPIGETECLAYVPMALVDDNSTVAELIDFEQTIFLQDRMILENQRPLLFPLDPRLETPTRADVVSIAYRRWLKSMDIRFGIYEKTQA